MNKKVGVFGGSFNPIHVGHINSLETVGKKLGLSQIRVIPAAQNPLKGDIAGPSKEHRLEMVQRALGEQQDFFIVDECEVQRGGASYTVETLSYLTQEHTEEEFYLIIGADQFEKFEFWYEYEKILGLVHLVVTSRPGGKLPSSLRDIPAKVRGFVHDWEGHRATLKTGKEIVFVQLENDIDLSSTEIRKRLMDGQSVEGFVPNEVLDYIGSKKLYEPGSQKIEDFEPLTHFCSNALFSRKGMRVIGKDLRGLGQVSEFVLIASATSRKHAATLCDHVVRQVKTEYGFYPQNIEGKAEGNWIVIDYGSLIVHVFYDYVRNEYRIEDLVLEGKDMGLLDPAEEMKKNNEA